MERHAHTHSHSHSHGHGHAHGELGPKLIASIAINITILVAQLIGGALAGSVALIADALHNLSDVASLGLSYGAHRLSKRPATPRFTYAFVRAEVLAALLNAGTLIGVSVYIAAEGVGRLLHPEPVSGALVMGFAAFGMIANGAAAFMLRGHGTNLNVRSAVLHLVSDSVASLGVLISGLLALTLHWYAADAVASLLLAAWMIKESVDLWKGAVRILMQGAPDALDLVDVTAALTSQDGVESVHDLHVWGLSPEAAVMSAHLVVRGELSRGETAAIVCGAKRQLHERFGIEHATLEVEDADSCAGGCC